MIRSTPAAALAAFLLAACASSPAPAPLEAATEAPMSPGFTDAELDGMRQCAQLSGDAFVMASARLQGLPRQEAWDRYGGRFSSPVLESVYRDRYDSPWAYSKEYFRSCAQRSAGIASLERLQLPTLCIWNRNIALIAKARASEGQPVEAVLRQLNFNSRESDQIIHEAYGSALPAYEFVNKIWNQCLGVSPG